MVDKYIKEEKWSPEEVLRRAKKWRGGKSGEISSGGQGGQYDRLVSPDANAMKCPPGYTMQLKKDSAGNMVPHCINDDTGEGCPKSQMVNGKCKGKGKFKKVKKGGPGPIKTDDDAKTSGGGEGETGGPGKGPGQDPDAEKKKKDKDKKQGQKGKGKDDEKAASGLSAEQLTPFRGLNSLEIYISGRGKGKDYSKLLRMVDLSDESDANKQKIKKEFLNSDWILLDIYDETFLPINTRYTPSTGERRGVLTLVPGGKDANNNFFEMRKLNGNYDKLGAGLSNMFEALTLVDYTIRFALSGAKGRIDTVQLQRGITKISNEVYKPALIEALTIIRDYDPIKDKDSKAKTAIYNSFNKVYPDRAKQQKMLSLIPVDDSKPIATGAAPRKQQESKTMNQDDIKKLIKEAFTDKVYGQYPYSHRPGDEEGTKRRLHGRMEKLLLSNVTRQK
jgi:hypothetical protein